MNEKKSKEIKVTVTLNPTLPTPRQKEAVANFGKIVYKLAMDINLPERKVK